MWIYFLPPRVLSSYSTNTNDIKIDYKYFERVEQFVYLGTTLTNQNFIPKEIKSRLKSGNVCYNSAQNLIFFQFAIERTKIKVNRNIILPFVLYECETWSLTFRKVLWLKVFQYKVRRRIFGPKRDEIKGIWRRLLKEELSDLYLSPNIIQVIETNENEMSGGYSTHGV